MAHDIPMHPDHDRNMRMGVQASRTCNIEVEAFEFVVLEDLCGQVLVGKAEYCFLETFHVFHLRTYWAAEGARYAA